MISVMENASHQLIFVMLLIVLNRLNVTGSADADITNESYNPDQYSTSGYVTPTKCHIHRSLTSDDLILTCHFAMDIRQAQKTFNVQTFRQGSESSQDLAVGCIWRKRLQCIGKAWIKLQQEDKTNVTFMMPLTESESLAFSCHLDQDTTQPTSCSLPKPNDNESSKLILIGIAVSVSICLLAISLFVIWLFIKRQKRKPVWRQKYEEKMYQSSVNVDYCETTYDDGGYTCEKNNMASRQAARLLVTSPQEEHSGASSEQKPLTKIIAAGEEEITVPQSESSDMHRNQAVTRNDSDKKSEPTEEEKNPKDGTINASVSRRESSLLLQLKQSSVCIAEQEKRKLRTHKQRQYLHFCQKLTNDTGEEEVDQHMTKCRELTFEIRFNNGLHKTLGSAYSLGEYSSESDAPEVLLNDAEKAIAHLESLQKAFFLKRLNRKMMTGSQGEKARLQAIEDFVNGARHLADKIGNDNVCNANVIEQYLKTVLELELECEFNEARIKLRLNSHKSNLRQEYEKMLLAVEDLQVDLEDRRAMLGLRLNDTVRYPVLQRMSQEINSETEYSQAPKKDYSGQDLETSSIYVQKDENLDQLLPNLENESIIIPAKHQSHVYAQTKLIGLKRVDIIISTDDQSHCNIQDLDNIHKKIHAAFSRIKDEISPQEMMVLMTQIKLDMYNKLMPNIHVNMKGTSTLERIRKSKENHSDIMIVNKQRGILGGIVQSVHLTDPVTVGKVLTDSVTRLTEAANFIEEWLKTVPKADNVAVRMTLILPNISRKQLDEQLATAVQSVVCLCKEEMDTLEGLTVWWEDCWTVGPGHSAIRDSSLYRNLLKTFAVPAIHVQKYMTRETHSQRENEAGSCRDRSSIFNHWSLLSSIEKLVDFDYLDDTQDDVKFLWGPSGTGKTILLQLRALQWASHFGARQIFILQTTEDGTAAACLMEHQLQSEVDVECTFTHLDLSRLWNRKRSQATTRVSTVVLTEEGKKILSTSMGLQGSIRTGTAVHVVADEADGDVVAAVYQLLKAKGAAVVRLWAAGSKEFQNNGILPSSLRHAACHVTKPLVCPKPAKGGEQKSEEGKQKTVGSPAVEILRHTRDHGGHTSSVYPWRCEQCSKDIVDKLKSHSVDAAGGDVQELSANDVFIMGSELACDKPDDDEFSPAPLIRILQSNGYNTSAMSTSSARDHVMSVIRKTMEPPAVTVTNEKYVWGLERNIIVYCESGSAADMDSKLRAICTTTRILIDIKSE